jgi:integrase
MIKPILNSLILERKDLEPEQFSRLKHSGFANRCSIKPNQNPHRKTSYLSHRKNLKENTQTNPHRVNAVKQLREFWSGNWNKALVIQPDALKHLSYFIEYRIRTTLELLQNSKIAFPYNDDTVIAWLFFQWLLLSKYKQNIIPATELPSWALASFTKKMLIEKHAKALNDENDRKKLNTISQSYKAAFSKALSEGLLTACLDTEAQQVIFGRQPTQKQIQELFTTTNLLIELGNHLEIWDLCFLNSIALPFHETNPFADENEWKRALRFEKTIDLINQAHEKNAHDKSFLHARVLTSLMIDSFILDEKTLTFVLHQLNSPEKLQRINNQIAIYISTSKKGEKLVFISPLTEIYYRQYLKNCTREKHPFSLSLSYPKNDFYIAIGKSSKTLKLSNFKSWKHSIKAYLQLKGTLSSMGLSYATGEFTSHPFLPKVLRRLFGFDCESSANHIQGENLSEHERLTRSYLWSRLRAILNVKHIKVSQEYEIRQSIKYEIKSLISDERFTKNEALLAQYSLARIDKSLGKEALSPSTILTHIDAFGLAVILSAGDITIKNISAAHRQQIYLNALDIKGIKAKRYLYYLKLFEDWLKQDYKDLGFESNFEVIPDYDEIFANVARPEFYVDASILSFEEYAQVKKQLIKAYIDSNGERYEFLQSTILLILGFKLDLRRGEAIYLKTIDYIFDETQQNLFIRAHENRKLKTNNATREFYLEEHLSDDEIMIFKDYFTQNKLNFNGNPPTYLFPEKKTTLVPSQRIINPLLNAIKTVTGDDDFKFHNLRHSKASWDMLSIFNAQFDLKLENTFFKDLPETTKFLSTSKSRWLSAVHSQNSIHKAPFYLHRQMGHGSLMTTFKNYIHTMDFVIAGFQQKQAQQDLSIEKASQLGIIKKSTLYKTVKDKDLSINDYLLERILPWSTFVEKDQNNHLETKETSSNDLEGQHKKQEPQYLIPSSLIPKQELQKLQIFNLFEALHFYLNANEESFVENTTALRLTNNVIKHFKQHKFSRFKMPANDASYKRLIETFNQLPKTWQQAIWNDSFWIHDSFTNDRELIKKIINRMSFKLEDPKDPLSLIKEVDIICNEIDQAKPIVELIRLLNWQIKCRFMEPKKPETTWQDWQESLKLSDTELNQNSLVKAKVNNSEGRLTIRLKKSGKSNAKFFEQYLLLSMLHNFQILGLNKPVQ